MALPGTIDSTAPTGSASPAQGDDQLRAIKLYIVDVFGVPDGSAVTAAVGVATTGGVYRFSQSPLTVPTLLRGTASQVLRIESQYSNLILGIDGASVLAVNATGLIQQTRFHEWVSGVTGVLGTQGADSLVLRTNTRDRWAVNPSGMFVAVASNLDIGTSAGPNPRNMWVASNLSVGGQITAGANSVAITTPTGMLDIANLTISGETQGDVLYRGSSVWSRLAPGSSGQFLQTRGTGANPAFAAGPIQLGQVTVAGQATGDVTYFDGSNWVRLAAGTSGQMLQTRASAAPGWVTGGPGVTESDNPTWSGTHAWSAGANFNFTSVAARLGLGSAAPTMMLDVRGNILTPTQLFIGAGANANPGLTFVNDPDTGLVSAAANQLAFVTGGAERGRFDSAGLFGVATTTPTQLLHIAGRGYVGSHLDIGGQLLAGSQNYAVTTTTGMLVATMMTFGAEAQGDVIYKGASVWTRLAPGTSGFGLRTQGAGANPLWADMAAIAATQTQMFVGTANTVFATPLVSQYHPGVAKAWVIIVAAGTILAPSGSYNLSSLTDTGTGDYTANFSTAFASSSFVRASSADAPANGDRQIHVRRTSASSSQVIATDGATAVDTDCSVAWFGSQ